MRGDIEDPLLGVREGRAYIEGRPPLAHSILASSGTNVAFRLGILVSAKPERERGAFKTAAERERRRGKNRCAFIEDPGFYEASDAEWSDVDKCSPEGLAVIEVDDIVLVGREQSLAHVDDFLQLCTHGCARPRARRVGAIAGIFCFRARRLSFGADSRESVAKPGFEFATHPPVGERGESFLEGASRIVKFECVHAEASQLPNGTANRALMQRFGHRGRHAVNKLVGFVDDHDIVLGDDPVPVEGVNSVERMVCHDDVGLARECAIAFREAFVVEWAGRANALGAGHGNLAPRSVRYRGVEIVAVTRICRLRPLAQPLHLRT